MDKLYVTPLFSVPVFNTFIKILDDEKQFIRTLEYERVKPNDNGWINKQNTYLLNDEHLTNLKDEIQRVVNIYYHDVLHVEDYIDFYITNSWAIKHDSGDYAQTHYHKNSLVSGVAYIDVDENSGDFNLFGPEEYYNIFPNAFSFDYKKTDMTNSSKWKMRPVENMVILFPSNVKHSVDKSQSNKSRYCIAFNTYVKGTFGKDISVITI